MECYYHPSRESTDICAICGKSICKECGLEIAGKIYCKDCLEKIVGLSLDNNQSQAAPEPARLEKQESAAEQIEMANLTKQPEEVHFSNQKIADDSPYNIKDNIQYEGGVQSTYDNDYQPQVSLHDAIENNQRPQNPEEDIKQEFVREAVVQEPVQNVRQEYVREDIVQEPVQNVREEFVQREVVQEPVQQARNEYDYAPQRQAPPSDDYIYPDHSYEPPARGSVEDKYERYLDDLYFDEEEVPLNEQLARDEAQYGSLTRKEYRPRNTHEQQREADDDLDRRIREELARREDEKRHPRRGKEREPIHNIQYEEEKEPYSALDIILTIILVIVIIIVVFYILYIFKLNATYPTFIDAILGLRNPGTLINALLH